jgi:hypothetical protein
MPSEKISTFKATPGKFAVVGYVGLNGALLHTGRSTKRKAVNWLDKLLEDKEIIKDCLIARSPQDFNEFRIVDDKGNILEQRGGAGFYNIAQAVKQGAENGRTIYQKQGALIGSDELDISCDNPKFGDGSALRSFHQIVRQKDKGGDSQEKESCPLCNKYGSERIKPKKTDKNWELLVNSQN